MADDTGQAGAIEITEEMIDAGVNALCLGLDPDGDTVIKLGPYSARALAKSIFIQMLAHRPGYIGEVDKLRRYSVNLGAGRGAVGLKA